MSGFIINEHIPHAPSKVFAFAIDPANATQVVQGVISSELVTEVPIGIGTRIRETREVRGKRATTELEIIGHEPPNKFAVLAEVSNIRVVYSYRFEAADDGTDVVMECSVNGRGIKRLLTPLVANVLKREDGDHLRRLAAAMG